MTKVRFILGILLVLLFFALTAEPQNNSTQEEFINSLLLLKTKTEQDALLTSKKELVNPDLVQLIIKKGYEHRIKGDYEEALRIFDLANRFAQQLDDQIDIAAALNNKATVYYFQGNYKQANDFNQKGLAISEAINDKQGIANAYHNFGLINDDQGNYDTALDYYNKSLELRTQLGDKRKIALSLSNIGRVHYSQADYAMALENFKQGLALFEEIGDKTYIASSLNNMGAIYKSLGNSQLALKFYNRSLKLREELGLKPGIQSTNHNIGMIYYSQGNYVTALEYFKKTQQMVEELGEKRNIANGHNDLGMVYRAQSDFNKAMNEYQIALKLREELSDKEGIGETLNEMGRVYFAKNDFNAARNCFQRSLDMHEDMRDKEGIADSLHNLAEVDYSLGDYDKALELAQKSSAILYDIGARDLLWQSQTISGKSLLALKQPDKAKVSFLEAIRTIESLREQVAGDEAEQETFFEDRMSPYHALLDIFMDQQDYSQAFSYAEAAKARILFDVLKNGRININKALTTEDQQQEQKWKHQLVSLNVQIQNEYQSEHPDQHHLEELKQSLEKTRAEYENFRNSMYALHPELSIQRAEFHPINLQEGSALLDDNKVAFLEYAVTEKQSYLFVITKEGAKVYALHINRTDLKTKTEHFREQLANRDLRFYQTSHELYDLLLKPAQQQLKHRLNLVIAPDAELWNLPFQALAAENKKYVLQEFSVSYSPSLTVMREMTNLRKKHINAPYTAKFLGFGNPEIKESGGNKVLGPLIESETEIKSIANIYGATQSKIYLRDSAQEASLKKESSKFKIVHLATHAVLDDSSPMYSHVMLSTPSKDSNEDGLLEAWEILNLDVSADLVVLSACETARGRVSAGEGVIGLSWALFVAGTPSALVSLWKVESESTTTLMIAFHKNLQTHVSKSQALRAAELQVMENDKFNHPFYWAAFVLIGDST